MKGLIMFSGSNHLYFEASILFFQSVCNTKHPTLTIKGLIMNDRENRQLILSDI